MNTSENGDKPYIATMSGFLDANMRSGRYSAGLVAELEAHLENRTANIFAILREIGIMEGVVDRPSTTKPASQFRAPWLKGLWHKHHTQARFQALNLRNHWNRVDFNPHVAEVFNRYGDGDPEMVSRELASRFVSGGLRERISAGQMTGEWIIFARENGVSTYLTLGIHGEDAAIWQRCRACAAEFPDLALLQEERAG